jgi:undecaprenyl-diphosphatase
MNPLLQRLNELEAPLCAAWNQRGHSRWLKRPFQLVSRLGDGVIWYLTMALLPLSFGQGGLVASAHMLAVGLASLVLYKTLKHSTHRTRPCHFAGNVENLMPALDEFSFPSGHTLHATAFTIVIAWHFPALGGLFGAFAVLVALSRLVLGLHYPSDVIAGAILGALLAGCSIAII